jgi:hypothetical protein
LLRSCYKTRKKAGDSIVVTCFFATTFYFKNPASYCFETGKDMIKIRASLL